MNDMKSMKKKARFSSLCLLHFFMPFRHFMVEKLTVADPVGANMVKRLWELY